MIAYTYTSQLSHSNEIDTMYIKTIYVTHHFLARIVGAETSVTGVGAGMSARFPRPQALLGAGASVGHAWLFVTHPLAVV